MNAPNKWTYTWPEAAAAGPEICGGKGYHLGRLERYGFAVPRGGVLAADAYREILESVCRADQHRAFLQQLSDLPAEQATAEDTIRKLDALRGAMMAAELPAAMCADVAAFLADARLAERPIAVRSSATAEDGQEASFAGVHQSVLNVRGRDAVFQAIKTCAASLWTPQAVAYRRHQGFADAEVACAVVLCEMIEPVAAGVAFSCDPRTGRPDCVVINAVAGLADELVGGRVAPVEFTIELRDSRLNIIERAGDAAGVLSDDQARELARSVWRVHWALGDGQLPQDVEWAMAEGKFWFVQARPVTRVPHVTLPAIADLPVIWSNANVDEVLPGVPTTMTWSMVQGTLRDILFAGPAATGFPLPRQDVCRRFAGRLYFDLTAMQWISYDAFGLPPSETNRIIGGHQPEIPVPRRSPYLGLRGLGRIWRCLKLVVSLYRAARSIPNEMIEFRRAIDAWNDRDLAALDFERLDACLAECHTTTAVFFHRFILASMTAGMWMTLLERALRPIAGDRSSALAGALMAGGGNVVTANLGYRLFDLARAAADDRDAAEYLRREPLDPHAWRRLPEDSPFRQTLENLLAEFGHRAVYESEIANPRWREDPSYLLEQTRSILDGGILDSREDASRKKQAEAEAEVARRTRLRRPLIRWMARRAREGAGLREAGRSVGVAAGNFSRAVVLEVADRLVADGRLAERDDVFHLSLWDLLALLGRQWNGEGARALVADRKSLADSWLSTDAPKTLVLDACGTPAQLPAEFHEPAVAAADRQPGGARALTGISAAPGRATGPCRVVRDPADGRSLRNGEILVARSTDPSWTPLFLRAAGVATEIGGHLSHAAIVAREYGLPAVLNIRGLMATARDGQELTVDGDAGRVIFDPARPPAE